MLVNLFLFGVVCCGSQSWPRSDSFTDKKFEELQEEHRDWPDRVASVKDSFAKVTADRAKTEL